MAQILCVDDSNLTRGHIKRILLEQNHTITEAHSGDEALTILKEKTFDCMLIDLLMPGTGGQDVIRKLRSEGVTMPVIVLTADVQRSTHADCLECGANAVITKPPVRDELLGVLGKVLAGESNT